MKAYLTAEVAPREALRESVREYALAWYREQRIEPPTAGRLDRFIASAMNDHETMLFADINSALSAECRHALDGLLSVSDDPSGSLLGALKAHPGQPSLEVVQRELGKLALIDDLGLPDEPFHSLSRKALENYRQRTATEPASALKERTAASRHALVAIYCWVRRREVIDDLVELLIHIVHKIASRAERRVIQEIVKDARMVRGKNTLLYKMAEAVMAEPDGIVRDVVFPVVGERTIAELVKEYRSMGPGYLRKIHTMVRASYGNHYRRMLPLILNTLEFRSNNIRHRPVMEALELIRRHRDSRQLFFTLDQAPIEGVY